MHDDEPGDDIAFTDLTPVQQHIAWHALVFSVEILRHRLAVPHIPADDLGVLHDALGRIERDALALAHSISIDQEAP